MPPLGPPTGVAIAAGEASIDEDVCAQLTAPSNSKSGRTSIVSRIIISARILFIIAGNSKGAAVRFHSAPPARQQFSRSLQRTRKLFLVHEPLLVS